MAHCIPVREIYAGGPETGYSKTEQAHEDGYAFLITLRHAHGTFRKRPQGLVQRGRLAITTLFEFIKGGIQGGRKRRQEPGEHGVDQGILRPKVIIDSGQIYLSLTGNHTKRCFREPTLGKQLFGSVKNAVNGIRLRHFVVRASSKRLFETYV